MGTTRLDYWIKIIVTSNWSAALRKSSGTKIHLFLYSSPGRTEVGGNHTDHNAGRVLAAAVDLDILAAAAPSNDRRIIINREGYRKIVVDIDRLEALEQEKSSPAALVGEFARD